MFVRFCFQAKAAPDSAPEARRGDRKDYDLEDSRAVGRSATRLCLLGGAVAWNKLSNATDPRTSPRQTPENHFKTPGIDPRRATYRWISVGGKRMQTDPRGGGPPGGPPGVITNRPTSSAVMLLILFHQQVEGPLAEMVCSIMLSAAK